jgi:hypothetical protein
VPVRSPGTPELGKRFACQVPLSNLHCALSARELAVEREIQIEDVHAGLAEEAKVARLDMGRD